MHSPSAVGQNPKYGTIIREKLFYKKCRPPPGYCGQRIFHMVNFSQLQERVRSELLRRINRGTLSVSLLARQTGIGQPHLSNFLHGRRQLSLATLDKILRAQNLVIADLLPSTRNTGALLSEQIGEAGQVPLVSHSVALAEPYIRASSVQRILHFPAETLRSFRPRCTATRRQWERFVAIRLSASDVRGMHPILLPHAIVVLDRHYNSFAPYHSQDSSLPRLYAVRNHHQLAVRYVDFLSNRILLRPHQPEAPADILEPTDTPNDLLIGRIALILNEL